MPHANNQNPVHVKLAAGELSELYAPKANERASREEAGKAVGAKAADASKSTKCARSPSAVTCATEGTGLRSVKTRITRKTARVPHP